MIHTREELNQFISVVKERFPINMYDLVEACRIQPEIYTMLSDEYAELKSALASLKTSINALRGTFELDARNNPDKYTLPKVTDSVLTAFLACKPEVISIQAQIDNYEYIATKLGGWLEAASQRRAMCREMTNLYMHKYYSNLEQNVVPTGQVAKVEGQMIADGLRSMREEIIREQ